MNASQFVSVFTAVSPNLSPSASPTSSRSNSLTVPTPPGEAQLPGDFLPCLSLWVAAQPGQISMPPSLQASPSRTLMAPSHPQQDPSPGGICWATQRRQIDFLLASWACVGRQVYPRVRKAGWERGLGQPLWLREAQRSPQELIRKGLFGV